MPRRKTPPRPLPAPPRPPTPAELLRKHSERAGGSLQAIAWGNFLTARDGEAKFLALWDAIHYTWPEFTARIQERNGRLQIASSSGWNPCLDRMLRAFTSTTHCIRRGDTIFRVITLTGAAGFGKTHVAGLYTVAWWLVDPHNSIATLTSTTVGMIRQRIWPVVSHYWGAATNCLDGTLYHPTGLLGDKVDSQLLIRSTKGDDKMAISALAVAHGETAKAIHNLKGRHAPRMLLVVDEANGTPEAIFEVIPNMRKGCRDLTIIIIGNPASRLDPHGRALTPEEGWSSVTEDLEEWRTKGVPEWQLDPGIALRFDGFKSPNVLLGRTIYPHIYSYEDKLNAERTPNYIGSFGYWTQDRGLHPPEGFANTVFTEQLFLRCDAEGHFTFDSGEVLPLAFLDPAFGGDACELYFGQLGQVAGRYCLQLTDHLEVPIDPGTAAHDIDYQIARRVQQECIVRGVRPHCFGLDATGIGRGVGAILAAEWSAQVQYMQWGQGATDRPSAQNDGRPSREVYSNYVTEIWYSVREALECEQIKGFDRKCMSQFCSREFRMGAKHDAKKLKLETKDDMRARVRYSPDVADACAGIFEVARRNGLVIEGKILTTAAREWDANSKRIQDVLGLGLDGDEAVVQDSGWAEVAIEWGQPNQHEYQADGW